MRKIKVNFIISAMYLGGTEVVLLSYLNNFNFDLYDVTLTITRKMYEAECFPSKLSSKVNLIYLQKYRFLNKIRIKKKLNYKINFYDKQLNSILLSPISKYIIKKEFKKIDDLVDIHIDFDSSWFYSHNKPFISFMHFSLTSKTRRGLLKTLSTIDDSASVILLNEDMMDEFVRLPLINIQSKCHVIYNPFNISKIRHLALEQLKESSILSGVYIVTVCRLDEKQKDVTTLIKAFQILRNDFGYLGNLVVVGDGHSKHDLMNLATRLDVKDFVIFLGSQLNPYRLIYNPELCVLSSTYQAFGNVLVEALAIGTPIVATDCPVGPRVILDNGNAGILTPVGDAMAMAKSINSVLTDSDIKLNLLSRATQHVEKFSVDKVLPRFYKIINNILSVRNN